MNTTGCVEIRAQYLNACLTDIRKFLRPLCRVHKSNASYEVILKLPAHVLAIKYSSIV